MSVLAAGACSESEPQRNVRAPGHEYFLPYSSGPGGLSLVNAGDFDDVIQVEAEGMTQPRVLYALDPATNRAQPHVLVYARNGDWYRVWLSRAREQDPVRLGAGSARGVCHGLLYHAASGNPDAGLLLFVKPGPNESCYDGDDAAYSLALDAGPDTIPTSYPGPYPLAPIYDGNGDLEAVLAARSNPNSLVLIPYPSGQAVDLVQSQDRVGYLTTFRSGAIVRVGRSLHQATLADGLSPALFTFAEGFEIPSAAYRDSEHVIFAEVNLGSSDRTPSRVWRLRLDGTASAERVLEFSDEGTEYVNLSAGRIWIYNSQGSAQILRWLDKNAIAQEPQLAERIEAGAYGVVVGGDRFFVSIQDLSRSAFSVKILADDGTVPLSRANAQIAGHVASVPEALWDGYPTASHVFWVQGNVRANVAAGTAGYRGADLVAYDFAGGQQRTLWRIDREALVFAYSIGPTGLGTIHYPGSAAEDVFAYDVEDGRFRIITATPQVDEEPIN